MFAMDGTAAVLAGWAPLSPADTPGKADLLPQSSHPLAHRTPAERRNHIVSLWKRGNVYWSYLYLDGIRYAQSTGTGNRRTAEDIERRFKEELNLRRHQIVQP